MTGVEILIESRTLNKPTHSVALKTQSASLHLIPFCPAPLWHGTEDPPTAATAVGGGGTPARGEPGASSVADGRCCGAHGGAGPVSWALAAAAAQSAAAYPASIMGLGGRIGPARQLWLI